MKETRRHADAATQGRGDRSAERRESGKSFAPCRRVAASPRLLTRPKLKRSARALIILTAFACVLVAPAQQKSPLAARERPGQARAVDRSHARALAIDAVCAENARDPLRSWPIDEMQARPSLPLQHPQVLAGTERARRLLPVARALTASALRELAREYGYRAPRTEAALARLHMVRRIVPDMELRDNAAVYAAQPHAIHFGTIFLAGLPSDEGMLSVLAHELAHIADGQDNLLRPLFIRVARRAEQATPLPRMSGRRAEELVCDLIGARAVRAHIARVANAEPLPRRAARALAHNCVSAQVADTTHLSPRNTIRAVLTLDPALSRALIGDATRMQPAPDSWP